MSQSAPSEKAIILPAQPPPLPCSLRKNKKSIAFNWLGVLFSSSFLPVVLFYSLHYGTALSDQIVFAITAGPIGVFSLGDNLRRTWKLLRVSDDSRPLGAGRWTLDFFHINFLISFVPITLFFSFGCALPSLTLMALPLPFLLSFVGVQFVVFGLLATKTNATTIFTVSSVPRGAPMRPPVYCIIEDVVAVNGSGGKAYRKALDDRYLSSPIFRHMLGRVGLFWGVGGCITGTVLIVLVGTIDPIISYGLAWTLPWAWTGVWTLITIPWVQNMLRREEEEWSALAST